MNGSSRIRLLQSRVQRQSVQNKAIAATAVGYIRVSTEEQAANGHSLSVQERAIHTFAASQGYDLVDVIADPGISGARSPKDRPGFANILTLAEARAFSVLLAWKFDRLARSLLFSVTTVNAEASRFFHLFEKKLLKQFGQAEQARKAVRFSFSALDGRGLFGITISLQHPARVFTLLKHCWNRADSFVGSSLPFKLIPNTLRARK